MDKLDLIPINPEYDLDLEPLRSDIEEDEKKDKKRKPQKHTIMQNLGGAAASVLDFLGAAPGVIGGTALAVPRVLAGKDTPKQAVGGIGEAAHAVNPMNWYPNIDFYRETPGYKHGPGTKAGEAIGTALEGYGKIAGWGSALTGLGDPEQSDAAAQLAVMAGLPFARGSGVKPGSLEAMRDMNRQTPASLKDARATYQNAPAETPLPKGQMELEFGPEGPMQPPGSRGVPSQEPSAVPPGTQGKFNLDPAEAQRISEEIMQEVSPEYPSERQGQLFGQDPRRPFTPEELTGRQFVMQDAQPSARNRPDEPLSQLGRPGEEAGIGISGATETRVGYPYEQTKLDLEPIPSSERQAVEQAFEKPVEDARRTARPDITYERPKTPLISNAATLARVLGPRSQRGSIGDMGGKPGRARRDVLSEIRDLEDQIRDAQGREEKDVVRFLKKELDDLRKELSTTDHIVERKGLKGKPGGKQSGAVDFGALGGDAFEGLVRVLKAVPRDLRHAQQMLEAQMTKMYDSRDFTGIARVERMYNKVNDEIRKQTPKEPAQPVDFQPWRERYDAESALAGGTQAIHTSKVLPFPPKGQRGSIGEPPPYGEPRSPERKAYIEWETRKIIAEKEAKLANLKSRDENKINWDREWQADTRVRSFKEAQFEIDMLKERLPESRQEDSPKGQRGSAGEYESKISGAARWSVGPKYRDGPFENLRRDVEEAIASKGDDNVWDNFFGSDSGIQTAKAARQRLETVEKEVKNIKGPPNQRGSVNLPKPLADLAETLRDAFKAHERGINPKLHSAFPKTMEWIASEPKLLNAILDQAAYYKRGEVVAKQGQDAYHRWLWDQTENRGSDSVQKLKESLSPEEAEQIKEPGMKWGWVTTPVDRAIKNIRFPFEIVEEIVEPTKTGIPDVDVFFSRHFFEEVKFVFEWDHPRRFEERFGTILYELANEINAPSANLPKGPKGQRGFINLFGDGKEKGKGIVGTLLDYKKQFNVDLRPLKKLLEEEKDVHHNTIKDIVEHNLAGHNRLDKAIKEGLTDAAIDKTMSILSASKGAVGKLIKWTVDNRREIDRNKNIRVEQATTKALTPWRDLKKSNFNDLMEAKEKWVENIGKTPLTREDFRTEAQWNVYKTIQEVFADGLRRTNEARKKIGLEAIPSIANYLPAIREGDYFVRIKDGKGDSIDTRAFNSYGEAKRAYDIAKKEFGSKFTVEEPTLREKSKYDLDNFAAFEETLKALEKSDPIKAQIQARYSYLLSRRGFGKHAILRKGIPGALGFEKGPGGVKNMERVLENYFKRQEAYIANIEKGQLQKQLAELPRQLQDKIPTAMEYMNEYLQASRGADLSKETMIRAITEDMMVVFGRNRAAGRHFLSDASSVASLLWLTTPKFLLSQIVQPLNALPKMAQIFKIDALAKNPAHAFFDGLKQALAPDAIAKEAAEWGKKKGYLESSIIGLLEGRMRDVKSEGWRIITEATKWGLGKLEQNMVRTPVFHMFETQLRDSIKNKEERFRVASELMDYYMVHYDKESTPLMYNKFGYVGEAARPLKQYSHNSFGQFFEYAARAKNQKEIAPLATYLGLQATVGGLKGMIGIAEVTALVTAINFVAGTQIPTPEQFLHQTNVPDWLIYGGYSTMLGRDVSASVSAPQVPNMFSFPGVEYTADAVRTGLNYIIKKASGMATDQDEMAFALAASPAIMRGWIEELYSIPGFPVPNPNSKMQGNYRRKDEYGDPQNLLGLVTDRQIAKWLSLKSIDEAKANAVVRESKKILMQDMQQRISALDAIADRVITQQHIDPKLISRYIAEGGDPSKLGQQIKKRLIDRSLTWPERQYMAKEITPQQAHKLMVIQDFLEKQADQLDPRKDELLLGPMDPNIRLQGANPVADKATEIQQFGRPNMADDGAVGTMKRAEKTFARADQMTREGMFATARKLFPDNPQKQKEWFDRELEMMKKIREENDQRLHDAVYKKAKKEVRL